MKTKLKTPVLLIIFLFLATTVFASMHGKKEGKTSMGMMKSGDMMGNMMKGGMMEDMMGGMMKGMMCNNHNKCYSDKRITMLLKNSDHLELSNEQIDKIREIMLNSKKEGIKKQAEVDILKIDKSALLMKDKIDLDSVKNKIVKIYKLKGEIKIICVESLIKVNNLLTDEQKTKIKEIQKKAKKGMMQGNMMKSQSEMKKTQAEAKEEMSEEKHESHH